MLTAERHVVVLSGAGISAESGIAVFRGPDGLWENHRPEDLATPAAFAHDPALVLGFYNARRAKVRAAKPNAAHHALAALQACCRVSVITQNVDNLHERAGSKHVLHLHGEIMKARSSIDPHYVVDLAERDLQVGDLCPKGGQLRPHIVWFGEAVPAMAAAAELAASADVFLVVGTSLQVYPAASLIDLPPRQCQRYLIDPSPATILDGAIEVIVERASTGVPKLVEQWLAGREG